MNDTPALNGPQVRRLLEAAIRCNARVQLLPTGEGDAPLSGQFVSADDQVLAVVLDRPHAATGRLLGRYVQVHVTADPDFVFSTDVIDDGAAQEPRQIVLRQPASLELQQRRRLWRARLAPSSAVELTWTENRRRCNSAATLLNLSCDGMACRLAPGARHELPVGRMIEVQFALPSAEQRFRLRAVVRNAHALEDGCTLLGMQFEFRSNDPAAERSRRALGDALYRRNQLAGAGEVAP